jgi:ParB-like chromosome segregation protein Spo0J
LLRTKIVDPLAYTMCLFFSLANRRVTVSREVPIIWATVFRAPLQQQLGQLLRRRVRQPQRADLVASGVVLVAQLLGHAEAGFAVLAKETQEALALDEVHLAGSDGLRRQLVRFAGDSRAQPRKANLDTVAFLERRSQRTAPGSPCRPARQKRKAAACRLLRNTRPATRTMRRCPRGSEGIFHGLRGRRGARSAHAVSDDA